jgi:cell division protein FtsL
MTTRPLRVIVLVLWISLLVTAGGVIFVKYKARTLANQIERLSQERDSLNAEWKRLQVEQSSWSSPGYVEAVATRTLHMSMPEQKEVKLVPP